MTTPDLFGGQPDKARGKHYVMPRGYFGPPGAGPEGQTCGTCAHLCCIAMSKRYWKCGRARGKWTHGRATDILVRSPACIGWAPQAAES